MGQVFPKRANQLATATLVAALVLIAVAALALYLLDRSSYHTKQGTFVAQQVPFSHDHHTVGLGIDCRYCHTSVEESSFAGIPPTATCINCHKRIWNNAELLEPVRRSFDTKTPLVWNRVNDLPDFVYFNHSIHIAKGIGCVTCHGPVDEMPLMYQAHSLQMGWCLDCHRNPEKYVRPREEVFNLFYEPDGPQAEIGAELVAEYDIAKLEHCSVCHR